MLKQQFVQMQKDEWYKKYLSAKLVAQEKNTLKWKDSLEYLINLLDELTALDAEDRSVALENFQVTPEKVNLRGTVASISTIYREGGIIDKFTQFNFIDFLDIPFYRKNGETFQFVLDATITANVWDDSSLR